MFVRLIFKNKLVFLAIVYLFVLVVLLLFSLSGIKIGNYSFEVQDQDMILQHPSYDHPLGTDQLGRDLLSRLIYGARLSFSVAIVTSIIAFVVGLLFGTLSGMLRGKTDFIISRFIDIIYSLPDLLVLSIVGLLFDRSTIGILFAIGLISWMDLARLTRAEILRIKQQEFILAATAIGVTNTKIFFKHIFPNILSTILVSITFVMPRAIIALGMINVIDTKTTFKIFGKR